MENYKEEIKTFCSECGPNVSIDEDGCCMSCGGYAFGNGVYFVENMRKKLISLGAVMGTFKAASCKCLTKTDDPKHHADFCPYKMICEALDY